MSAVRLRPRSAFALGVTSVAGLLGFGWPLLVPHLAGAGATGQATDAPWVFVGLIGLLLAVVMAELAEDGIDAKAIAVLGVLAGCGAALRPVTGGATGFTLLFFLLVPAGRVFGRGFGFVLGAVTLLASSLLTAGVGPWLPFEMLGAGWVGFGAGCLPRLRGRWEVVLLATYGALTGLLYGALLNLSFWPFTPGYPGQIAFVPRGSMATNVAHWIRFDVTTSLGFDLPRAAGNAALLLALGGPVLVALRRVHRRAAFDAAPTFSAEGAGDPQRDLMGVEGVDVDDERRDAAVELGSTGIQPLERQPG
jgi:energy-coupling factor transport system substrate-specific component